MKRLFLLVCTCTMMCIPILSAQHQIDLNELLSRLNENHMGGIDEVFTEEEIDVLLTHFNAVNQVSVLEYSNINRRGASTKSNVPVSVVRINPLDVSTVENLGPSSTSEFEGAGYIRNLPNIKTVVVDNANTVFTRGLNNNNYTNNGPVINIPPSESLTGLEVLTDGRVMGVTTNGVDSSHLVEINPGNWTANVIGPNNGLVVPISLARDSNDNLFVLDIDDNGVFGMDRNTGVVTFIGNCGFDPNFGQGMGYDEASDEILMTAFNNSTFDSELRVLNPNTGVAALLGTITPGVVDQFGYVSWYDADILGVNDIDVLEFTLSPNPSSDFINLDALSPIERVSIFNLLGQQIKGIEINSNTTRIDISALNSGMYFLHAEINGEFLLKRFIKE